MNDLPRTVLTEEESAALARRRRGRNIAMLIALLAFSALFYAITLVKLTSPDLAQ
jgi:hypothetical protein